MDAESYRRLQVDSVTGHAGSSVLEIQLITSSIQLSLWLLHLLPFASSLPALGRGRFLTEFALIVLPQTIVLIYSNLMEKVYSGMLVLILILLGGRLLLREMPSRISQTEYFAQARLPFVTSFRASIMVLTMLCILAVDFNSFPRSWAKTETFGTSLMDVGVGCIIFSSGLVSSAMYMNGTPPSLAKSLKSSLSMLVLGLTRLALVKWTGYQEHISEYGMHWNFFLTLAALPALVNILSRIISIKKFISAGVLISVAYELVLRYAGVQNFVFEGHRNSLFAMNKEGILGIVGCCALFMISCGFGSMMQNVRMAKVKNRAKLMLLKIFFFCIASWAIYALLTRVFHLVPSRRLMNLSFVVWSSAVSITHLLLLFITDISFMAPSAQSSLLIALNDNQLLAFLLANLGTGLVNKLFQTLLLPQSASISILSVYAFTLCSVIFALKRLRIVLRLK